MEMKYSLSASDSNCLSILNTLINKEIKDISVICDCGRGSYKYHDGFYKIISANSNDMYHPDKICAKELYIAIKSLYDIGEIKHLTLSSLENTQIKFTLVEKDDDCKINKLLDALQVISCGGEKHIELQDLARKALDEYSIIRKKEPEVMSELDFEKIACKYGNTEFIGNNMIDQDIKSLVREVKRLKSVVNMKPGDEFYVKDAPCRHIIISAPNISIKHDVVYGCTISLDKLTSKVETEI